MVHIQLTFYYFLGSLQQNACRRRWKSSPTNPEHHCNNLHVEEGKDQVKLNPERHDDHFQGGEGEDQIQLPPEKHVDHLHAEEGEY